MHNMQSKIRPKFFWISAIAPLTSVILGSLLVYLTHAEKHGVQVVSIFICIWSISLSLGDKAHTVTHAHRNRDPLVQNSPISDTLWTTPHVCMIRTCPISHVFRPLSPCLSGNQNTIFLAPTVYIPTN